MNLVPQGYWTENPVQTAARVSEHRLHQAAGLDDVISPAPVDAPGDLPNDQEKALNTAS